MSYTPPAVGTVLPAQKNTTVTNPGPVHSPTGVDPWLQAQAQDLAYENNLDLVEQWKNAVRDNPPGSEYAANLGNALSWAVLVVEAEAGGITFDQQKIGPAVNTLEA